MDFRRRTRILKWAVLLVTVWFAVAVAIGLLLHWNGWSCASSAACVARLGWLPAIHSAADALSTPGASEGRRGLLGLYATLLALLAPLAAVALFASAASLALGAIRRSRQAIMIAALMGIVTSFVLLAYGSPADQLFPPCLSP